jgi:hypothetical protein
MMTNKFESRESIYDPSISLGKGHKLILSETVVLSLIWLHQEEPYVSYKKVREGVKTHRAGLSKYPRTGRRTGGGQLEVVAVGIAWT